MYCRFTPLIPLIPLILLIDDSRLPSPYVQFPEHDGLIEVTDDIDLHTIR